MSSATGSPLSPVAPVVAGEAPYPGPRPFSTQERDRFYGRQDEVLDLVSLIRAHHAVLIYAPSGVGKSSLVEAGLRPQLEGRGRCVVYPTTRVRGPGWPLPWDMVGNVYVRNVLTSLGAQPSPPGVPHQGLASALGGLRWHDPAGDWMRVVIVDQLEEIFTFYPERWRDRLDFFQQIQQALGADPFLRFVLVLRDDFLARLKPYTSAFSDDLRTQYALERLRRDAALDAIQLPTRGAGRTLSDDAAEELVDSLLAITPDSPEGPPVLGEFVEPVELQVVCLDLWQRLPGDITTITAEHVREFARIGEVLARFYDDSVAATVKRAGVPEKKVRAWVERSLITPSGTRGLVFRDSFTTGGLSNAAVDVLEERRIIRSEQRGGSQWYELTHDRLVDAVRDSNRRWGAKRASRLRRRSLVGAIAVLTVVLLVVGAIVADQVLEREPLPNLMSLSKRVLVSGESLTAEGVRGTVLIAVRPHELGPATVEMRGPQGQVVPAIYAECLPGPGGDSCPDGDRLVDLPADGTYTLKVISAAGGKVWFSSQRAWHGQALESDDTVRPPAAGSPQDVRLHRLHSDEPGVAFVDLHTETGDERTDPNIESRREDGRFVRPADYTWSSGAALFLTFPGTYLIRPDIGGRDSYALTVTILDAPPMRPGYTPGELTDEDDRVSAHRVELAEGDVALFEVTSEFFPPALLALSPSGDLLSEMIVERESEAAFLGIKAPTRGTYYLVVSEGAVDGSGREYRLSYNHISGLQT